MKHLLKNHRNKLLLIFALGLFLTSCKDQNTYVMIETDLGNMKMMLYNETPLHKENFIKLVSEDYYEDLLFHRVIPGFMAQGGDPDSRNATSNARLGGGGPGYTIPAEIGAPHLRGTVAAARLGSGNPEKKSSGSQFFIVQGGIQSAEMLTNLERSKKIKYNETQKELYQTIGGYPSLDGDYTVFGEIVEGIEVIDKIAMQETAPGDRPVKDIRMKIKLLD